MLLPSVDAEITVSREEMNDVGFDRTGSPSEAALSFFNTACRSRLAFLR